MASRRGRSRNLQTKKNTQQRAHSLERDSKKLSLFERKQRAKALREEEERKKKEEKEKLLAEKKERIKQLRQGIKEKEEEKRQRFEEKNDSGDVKCPFCKNWVEFSTFDEHIITHPSQIRTRLWLGDYENQKDLNLIKRLKITHIVNCAGEINPISSVLEYIGKDNYLQLKLSDKVKETAFNKKNINIAVQFMENALSNSKNILLIHCREGKSRSVSFLSTYLMWKENISFHSVLADIRSKRYMIQPNAKFYTILQEIDKIFAKKNNDYIECKKENFKLKSVSTKSGFNLLDYDRNNDMKMEPINYKKFYNDNTKDKKNHFRKRSHSLTEEDLKKIRANYNQIPLMHIRASFKKSRLDKRLSNRFIINDKNGALLKDQTTKSKKKTKNDKKNGNNDDDNDDEKDENENNKKEKNKKEKKFEKR